MATKIIFEIKHLTMTELSKAGNRYVTLREEICLDTIKLQFMACTKIRQDKANNVENRFVTSCAISITLRNFSSSKMSFWWHFYTKY